MHNGAMVGLLSGKASARHAACALLLVATGSGLAAEPPAEVSFLSGDGRTMLRGYLFMPQTPPPWPAVVMLHGRSGPYSSAAVAVSAATAALAAA